MLAILDLNETLPAWRSDDGGIGTVAVLDAYREPQTSVLITQRGYTWFWSVSTGDMVHANGKANTYEGAAAAAGDFLKGQVN